MSADPTMIPVVTPAPVPARDSQWTVPPEVVPDLDNLEIETDEPADNIFIEKQHRLLVDPLYNCWQGGAARRPFLALANVGLFSSPKEPPLAPDVMLSMDVQLGEDVTKRENRSYYVWVHRKPPDVVFEFVSDKRGGEAPHKMREYAFIRVPYYVIFDPQNRLNEGILRAYRLQDGEYQPLDPLYFPLVGLGVTLWEGIYEDLPTRWLRWCDEQGVLIPTGLEALSAERQLRDQAKQDAEKAKQRAEKAVEDLTKERQRREALEARLRELGLEP